MMNALVPPRIQQFWRCAVYATTSTLRSAHATCVYASGQPAELSADIQMEQRKEGQLGKAGGLPLQPSSCANREPEIMGSLS
jgi:hypothetical protein